MQNTTMPGEATANNTMLRAESHDPSNNSGVAESTAAERPTDVFLDFAVSLEETARRVKMLQQYVREHMVEGEDFGIIPGSTKPTLFKPGAEKLNSVFGLAPVVEITNRVEDWDKGFVSYEIKVTLINKRTQQIEAEGIGSCNSKERRYARQDAPSISNTVLKMAKKRALIDATLSATRASGLFTQDLEDLDDNNARNWSGGAPRQESRPAPRAETRNDGAREEQSTPSEPRQHWSGSGDSNLTDAQHRAILAIAGRVFGRPATAEDFSQLSDKPVEDLTKGEASALIDRLRFRLAENQGGTQNGATSGARGNFNRASQNGAPRNNR
jgi:hypothetical protein